MMSKTTVMIFAVSWLSAQPAADDGIIIRKNQRTLEQIQRIYAEMPPVEYWVPSGRWENLPRTKKKLLEGGALRVVMLGDSIINDTSRSCWNLVLEMSRPKCKVEKITSVRGSTGCWWYKEPGRVQKFVLDHQPDLVIIGGISQRGDTDSIRDVVRQIRAGSNAEILLMTGPFGSVDPRDEKQWRKIIEPDHYDPFRRNLESLAREVGAAFLDMQAAWGDYIRLCGRDLEWFKRDPIHADERGEQILGRILTAYLSPMLETHSCPSFVLSTVGCGRATAYSESNKIVTVGTRTHVSCLDSENGQFLVRIRTLDRRTGIWSPTYTVGQAFDNHGGPSLTSDSQGYLHIVYYPHHHPFRYRRSLRPNDASQWTDEIQFGTRCTYSSLVCMPDGTLVLTCRESTKKQWLLNLYRKPFGGVWQGPHTILHGQAPSGYTRWQSSLALGSDKKILHMSFMLYEQSLKPVGYAVGYLRSPDMGASWQRSDGRQVPLSATVETIDIVDGATAPEGPTNFRPGNIAVDSRGVPWILYCRMDRQPLETWLARPNAEGGWHKISLLQAVGQKWPGRAVKTPGCVVFGQDGTMYAVVTTVDADAPVEAAGWGHPSAEIVLLVSRNCGETFDAFEISPPDSSVPNWLPNLERPTGPQPVAVPSLIYTHGHKGQTNQEIMRNDVAWCDPAGLRAAHTSLSIDP